MSEVEPNAPPVFFRYRDSMRLFGVCASTMKLWVKNRWVKAYMVPTKPGNIKGPILISYESTKAFIESREI